MVRRLFLIETNLESLAKEIKARDAEVDGIYNIIETFIEDPDTKALTQILSIFEIGKEHSEASYAKAVFEPTNTAWRLEQLGDREEISSEKYYDLLLSNPNRVVEPKARIVFKLSGVRYSLESNSERNYSVIQIEYNGDESAKYKRLFKEFASIDVLGELYMSLEETFARLHLKEKPAGSLQEVISILNNTAADNIMKVGT